MLAVASKEEMHDLTLYSESSDVFDLVIYTQFLKAKVLVGNKTFLSFSKGSWKISMASTEKEPRSIE